MRSLRFPPASIVLLIAAVWAAAPPPAVASEGDEEAVAAAVGAFYSALNDMFTGDLESMREVWSHADDVTYMGPGGGIQVGWPAVLESWEAQAAMELGGEVQPADVHTTVGGALAVTVGWEIGTNVAEQQVRIRATNVFRKESGAWKMIGHHTDLLPFLQGDDETPSDGASTAAEQ
ncbi:MAG TPA: nuclear transport factor 2 family protein [Thermoanaerobaculia bacterium]|nr:nuclear transport factor 2 family protein [Thermoanaerobaculia bacterium]